MKNNKQKSKLLFITKVPLHSNTWTSLRQLWRTIKTNLRLFPRNPYSRPAKLHTKQFIIVVSFRECKQQHKLVARSTKIIITSFHKQRHFRLSSAKLSLQDLMGNSAVTPERGQYRGNLGTRNAGKPNPRVCVVVAENVNDSL